MVPFGRQMFGLKWEKEVERMKKEVELTDRAAWIDVPSS